ncbi:flagellar hook-basal body complex protein [Neobacillus sp. PS2-9]|uniref:flagellar hook-basal body complex protein n=1 Tax=Neobacillus sp. PS2-9 TaxID=3070676 RepID=UPI0027E0D7CB|nr:flagellar hook-basal body complex protein [Neobacillus sp. PS2-9]WML56334.1 flagellar hook-basal body complex protein [Neobacillus sp. PS2-9]
MLKSLYSGVSGMKGFQTKLDIIGNNVANVNTVGFKKSRVMFQDIINQNISGATAPTTKSGGINPQQVGLGTKIGSIDTVHTPGSPMTTNVGTDLAIDGDAFFVVSPETPGTDVPTYLTKAGNFTRDTNGFLVNSNGFFVNGVVVGGDGKPQNAEIKIVADELNLDKDGKTQKFTSFSIDSNGYINVVREDGESGKLAMDSAGKYYLSTNENSIENISLATAVVPNPAGLKKIGNTMFEGTGNSGDITPDRIENNKGGTVNAGILEMSNVDLTEEFTEMIVAQRGFQANARTITTSDSILEEVVNLKR